jgi:hypothetical protein
MAKGMQLQAMPQGGGIIKAHASNGLCCTCKTMLWLRSKITPCKCEPFM